MNFKPGPLESLSKKSPINKPAIRKTSLSQEHAESTRPAPSAEKTKFQKDFPRIPFPYSVPRFTTE
jgi:hypothetical protein